MLRQSGLSGTSKRTGRWLHRLSRGFSHGCDVYGILGQGISDPFEVRPPTWFRREKEARAFPGMRSEVRECQRCLKGVGSAVPLWRVVNSTFFERVHLRKRALLETYQESLEYVRALRPNEPVIPVPSPLQCRLEGAIIGRIGYLFDPARGQGDEFKKLEPLRIWAESRSYTVQAAPEGLASTLSRLLPTWSPHDTEVENGVAGLRYDDYKRGAGVSFFFPGQVERFTVLGISLWDLESYRLAHVYDRVQGTAKLGDPLHRQERASHHEADARLVPLSAIARRLGLLVRANFDAIDSWWSDQRRFAVELLTSSDRHRPMIDLLAELQSPHFAPQLRRNVEGSSRYNHLLEIDGAAARIDLRYHSFFDEPTMHGNGDGVGEEAAQAGVSLRGGAAS